MFGNKRVVVVEVVKKIDEENKIVFLDKLDRFSLKVNSKSYENIHVGDSGQLTIKNNQFKKFICWFSKGEPK